MDHYPKPDKESLCVCFHKIRRNLVSAINWIVIESLIEFGEPDTDRNWVLW